MEGLQLVNPFLRKVIPRTWSLGEVPGCGVFAQTGTWKEDAWSRTLANWQVSVVPVGQLLLNCGELLLNWTIRSSCVLSSKAFQAGLGNATRQPTLN